MGTCGVLCLVACRLADKARIESLEAENQRLQTCLKAQEELHRKKVRVNLSFSFRFRFVPSTIPLASYICSLDVVS